MANFKAPVLFAVLVNGREVAAVRAVNASEVRDWHIAQQVEIRRLSPTQAFHLGSFGEVEIHNAKPEYAEPSEEETGQGDFFRDLGAGKTIELGKAE